MITFLALILFNAFTSRESKQSTCRDNSSVFVLLGNPGIIWHPKTGQCVHTKMERSPVSGGNFPDEPSET